MADVASWAARHKTPPPVGRFADKWQETPEHAAQFDPELNAGFDLTQLPPAGSFEIRWRCSSGHQWFMTPDVKRRMAGWKNGDAAACPECVGFRHMRWSTVTFACSHVTETRAPDDFSVDQTCLMCEVIEGMGTDRETLADRLYERSSRGPLPEEKRAAKKKFMVDGNSFTQYAWNCPDVPTHHHYSRSVSEISRGHDCRICWHEKTELALIEPGTAFIRTGLDLPTSRAERELRALLSERVRVDNESLAVRVSTRFFGRLEVWPDILITGLRVAVEYDTPGRSGEEHIGGREVSDRAKDAVLRDVGWEVIRVRVKGLQPLGPYDIEAAGVSQKLANAIVSQLRVIRGDAAVDAELV